MPSPDYATWLTKQQAAAAIGVTTKTIEAWAQAQRLQQAFRPQARGPRVAVYDPDDVARLASERHPAPAPFVLPVGAAAAPRNGDQRALSVPSAIAGEDLLREFLRGLVRAVGASMISATPATTSESSQKSFLTIQEASVLTGLSRAYLRRAIDAGTLKAIRDRGWRIRRRDLEQL